MKFKIDENLPVEVKELLNEAGHDALLVVDQQLGGASDNIVSKICQEEKRVIVTLDLDFADIRTYPPQEFAVIIVLRLKRQDRVTTISVLKDLLEVLKTETLEQTLWIVDEQRIRIRE